MKNTFLIVALLVSSIAFTTCSNDDAVPSNSNISNTTQAAGGDQAGQAPVTRPKKLK